jgi:hypothetical protein
VQGSTLGRRVALRRPRTIFVLLPFAAGFLSFGVGAPAPLGAAVAASALVTSASVPTSSPAYWVVARDGAVSALGPGPSPPSTAAMSVNTPIVGMAATPQGRGYWLVASDGGIFSFGDAQYYGSTGATHLNEPIVGMAATPQGRGYWLVASDGGIFSFGDAPFDGSLSSPGTPGPVVGIASSRVNDSASSAGPTTPGGSLPGDTSSTPGGGMTPATSAASPSVMIQISTMAQDYTPSQFGAMLAQICPPGVTPEGDVVLQDVASADGTLLISYLNEVLPYLPGASTHPCFDRVFVGTIEPNWTGTGNAYINGVEDTSFVARYVAQSSAIAQAFVSQYPQIQSDWYITYEANLNELYDSRVLSGYENLLEGILTSFNSLRPGRTVMWSPAFWFPYSSYKLNTLGMSGLSQSLTTLFGSLHSLGGISIVDLQDYVAGSSCQPASNKVTPTDAVNWVHFVAGLAGAPQVMLNTEQYSIECATGAMVDGNPAEVTTREAYYVSQGMKLGPAFELRYWLINHGS